MNWRNMRRGMAASLVGVLMSSSALTAETLTDALIHAYRNSPTLEQNRAALRGADEGIVQARASRKPQVTAGLDANGSINSVTDEFIDSYSAGVQANLLLWDGGRTKAAIQSAAANIDASRAQLGSIEQNVLLNAVTAYADVRRDERFVMLAQNNVDVIARQLEAAQDRFDVGEVTRTDVSQAQSFLASARSNLAQNRGSLESSRQSYAIAVGKAPGKLSPLPPIPALPKSVADAQAIAVRHHPAILAAQHSIRIC